MVRKVGELAYELELPEGSKIRNLFHVSCLKMVIGKHISVSETLPPLDDEGQLILIPEGIVKTRERKLRIRTIKEYLVQWKDHMHISSILFINANTLPCMILGTYMCTQLSNINNNSNT